MLEENRREKIEKRQKALRQCRKRLVSIAVVLAFISLLAISIVIAANSMQLTFQKDKLVSGS